MKKDIFNFQRFGKYFKSDIRTCAANYGLSLITISILMILALYVFKVGFGLMITQVWDGPGAGFRFFVFLMAIFCIVVTMPVKCYGKLTEKQYGSQWLMIPASRLEKFVSMTILTCIVVPLTGAVIYLGVDALLCAVDPTCGKSLIGWAVNLGNEINELFAAEGIADDPEFTMSMEFLEQFKSPWLYIDDCIQMALPFLVGALFFKNGKTVKTFLALAAIGTAASIVMTPIMLDLGQIDMNNNWIIAPESIFNNWFFQNIALVDTISDTVTNVALLTVIYFRIKTLKH